jgi:hypothetical protein
LNSECRVNLLAPIAKPFDFRFGLLSRIAKPFLHFAHEFTALSVNYIKVVIRQLSSLLLNFAFQLLPVALDLVPIHDYSPTDE